MNIILIKCEVLHNTIKTLKCQLFLLQQQVASYQLQLQNYSKCIPIIKCNEMSRMNYFNESDFVFKKDFGCTQKQFKDLYNECMPYFKLISQKGGIRCREARLESSHSNKFQLMVTLFWLRRYLEEEFIGRIHWYLTTKG